jgi:hypothetical protein
VNNAQENVLGGQPGDVQSFVEKLPPGLFDLPWWQGRFFRLLQLGFLGNQFL